MNLKLAISCIGSAATVGAAVTRANNKRTSVAVGADGDTFVIDPGMQLHTDTLLQSFEEGISSKQGATRLVSVVEDLAKRAAANGGAAPDLAFVSTIKEFAQTILEHTTTASQQDEALLQQALEEIQKCPTVSSHMLEDAGVLETEAGRRRDEHESCRLVEIGLLSNKTTHCNEYDAYRATVETDMDECTGTSFKKDIVSKDEIAYPEAVAAMETCLVGYTPWIEELHRLYLACHLHTGEHESKKTECNDAQANFEHGFCDHYHKLQDHCDQLDGCYNTAVASQATAHASVEARVVARKADWTAGSRISCYAKVFEASQEEKQAVLSGCQSETITTDHLDLQYPDTPARPACTTLDAKPCDGTWEQPEYLSKPWYEGAPTATCRECSV